MTSKLIREKLKVTDMINGIAISRPKQMYAWPGIIKISENELLISASERRSHRCPFGREVIIRSLDGGQTWGLPQEVYNSELDDRDANLTMTSDGTLILSWFTSTAFEKYFKERASRITQKMRDELIGSWMCISKDKGHNWESAQRMPAGVHISPIALSDDSLIIIDKEANNEAALAVYKSKDLGQSWEKVSKIQCPQFWLEKYERYELLFNENHILEISPGKLITMFRSNPGGDGYLYQSFSDDNGMTWSEPHKTDIWGFPPHLARLSNGVIMCSYGHRCKPYSVRIVFSYDEGKTWDTDNITTLYEWDTEIMPDMGYPVSLELTPGNIITVFYCSFRDIYPKTFGERPEGILSVKFKV